MSIWYLHLRVGHHSGWPGSNDVRRGRERGACSSSCSSSLSWCGCRAASSCVLAFDGIEVEGAAVSPFDALELWCATDTPVELGGADDLERGLLARCFEVDDADGLDLADLLAAAAALRCACTHSATSSSIASSRSVARCDCARGSSLDATITRTTADAMADGT